MSLLLRLFVTCGCTLYSRLVIVRKGDSYSLVDSYIAHLPSIGLAGLYSCLVDSYSAYVLLR